MKKLTSLILTICMLSALFAPLSVLPASAATSGTTGDCTWRLDGTKLTISGNGAMGNYSYASRAPWGSDITSVVMEDGVTSIGNYAFYDCTGLTSVTIGNSVTSIGADAFRNCTHLTSVTIPDSVTSIETWAFFGCALLSEINVSSSNSSYASVDGVLFSKDLKTLVCYPAGKGDSYIIPNSVTSIGNYAFSGCTGLTSVTIGNSVTSIGGSAFSGCTGLTSVTIGNSVTSIENGAFLRCTGLTSVTIPNSVKSIDIGAFAYCTGLTSVTIGNSVASIGDEAFTYCERLTSITIPDSVTSIAGDAFYNCDNLTIYGYAGSYAETYALEKNIPFGVLVLTGTTGDCTWTLSESEHVLTISGEGAMADYALHEDCNGDLYLPAYFGAAWEQIWEVIIEDGVTHIGANAFYDYGNLESVTIPDSVTSIGECAFYYCISLNSVTIPESVTSIANSAFLGCAGRIDTGFTICGYASSVAETYATENGHKFVDITPAPTPTHTVEFSTEGEGSVTATVNGEAVTGNELSVKKGDVVTLTAGEGFKFWKNAKNNTILSTDSTLTVPVTRDVAFVAVFESALEDETRLVYFKDSRTGKVLKRMTVETGYVLQESDFPEAAFKGYKLKGFRVGNVDAVGYVVDHLVEVYTIYQKDLSSSKLLTIYNGGRTSKTQRTFGEVVVVEARAKNFSYWTLDGKIISMDRVYRFNMPDRACDLVAVENKSIPEAVCATVDLSKEGQSFYYLMSRSLSKGNTLLETGVLMTRKATADDLTVDTANNTVTRGYSTADAEYDVVGFVKDATGKTGTWLVRGYITYETADGAIKTVYTDVSSIVIE